MSLIESVITAINLIGSPVITADQLWLHGLGDYVLQSDWMANNKTKAHWPAFCHALTYSLPFIVLKPSVSAWLVIFVTHFFIDRYRLARYVCWAKNWMAPKTWWSLRKDGVWESSDEIRATQWRSYIDLENPDAMRQHIVATNYKEFRHSRNLPFPVCSVTGYPPDRPAWMAVWLLIACDNLIHVLLNGVALKWL